MSVPAVAVAWERMHRPTRTPLQSIPAGEGGNTQQPEEGRRRSADSIIDDAANNVMDVVDAAREADNYLASHGWGGKSNLARRVGEFDRIHTDMGSYRQPKLHGYLAERRTFHYQE